LHIAWPRNRESLPKVHQLVEVLSSALRMD
jgi:hypothetical protein